MEKLKDDEDFEPIAPSEEKTMERMKLSQLVKQLVGQWSE
jgi:hypothetical protein